MPSVFQVLANYPNPHNSFALLLILSSELMLVMTWPQNQVLQYMGILPKPDI